MRSACSSGSIPAGSMRPNSGDPLLLEQDSRELAAPDVERLFGQGFAADIAELPIGRWSGPVESGYGLHLVLVHELTPARLPELDEIRGVVTASGAPHAWWRPMRCSTRGCGRPTRSPWSVRPCRRGVSDAAGALAVRDACLCSDWTPVRRRHEVRPAYLELRQTGPETWDVLWKVPARGDLQLAIAPAWPDNCDVAGAPLRFTTGGAATERSTVRCAGGLTGREVAVSGLSGTVIDVLVRLQRSDGTAQVVRLTPSAASFVVEDAPRWTAVAATYLGLGIEHILFGIDHLLFVLGLLLLVGSWRRLVATVTAFTVAHSITLAAATLGFVHVPSQPVEAAIALSIVFVAVEIVHGRTGQPGLTERWPWLVAFVFGLLHGLGFAGALSEVGLPENAIPTALLFFNLGVELGQLAFVGAVLAVLALLALPRTLRLPAPAWSWRLAPYGIGTVAMYWTIERMVAFAA